MKLALIIGGILLLGIIIYAFIYGRSKRRALAEELSSLTAEKIEFIAADSLKGLKTVHKELSLADFYQVVALIEREFRPGNSAFLSLLPRDRFHQGFQECWAIDMGVVLGELMRKHSASPSEWARDEQGFWKLKISTDPQPYWWDPFKEAERLYAGKVPDPLMSLQLIKMLK